MNLYRYNRGLLLDCFNSVDFPTGGRDALLELFISGHRIGSKWVPPAMELLDDCGEDCDFPPLASYSLIPVVSVRAWHALQPFIGTQSEALPFEHPRGEYLLLNVLNVVDCVDLDRSRFSINEVTGRVSNMTHFVFKNMHLIEGKHLFWTPSHSGRNILVDDAFRDCVLDHKLVGLDLRPVP